MVKSESARPTGQVIPHCRPFETIALGSLVVYWPDLMFESYRDPILSKQKCLWSLEIANRVGLVFVLLMHALHIRRPD